MYETSLLIFNNLFTGNDFTQNIKWLDSRLNLKYDFLKCSWNSYCFKYKLARVPGGMNAFHFLTADNLNVQFYLHYLYSLFFPIKGWKSSPSCSAAWSRRFPGNGRRGWDERRSFWTGTLPCQCQIRHGYLRATGSQEENNNCTAWGVVSFSFSNQIVTLVPIICTTVMCHP